MSKLRADSNWSALTAAQRETLEGWLFEENLSYREALDKVAAEFGMVASLSGLARLYRQMAGERMQAELRTVQTTAKAVGTSQVDGEQLGAAAMTLVAKRLIQLAVERPERVKELGSLARVLLVNDANEIKRRWLEMEEERRFEQLEKERMEDRIAEIESEDRQERILDMLRKNPRPGATLPPVEPAENTANQHDAAAPS